LGASAVSNGFPINHLLQVLGGLWLIPGSITMEPEVWSIFIVDTLNPNFKKNWKDFLFQSLILINSYEIQIRGLGKVIKK
jgi:hypothetical protein